MTEKKRLVRKTVRGSSGMIPAEAEIIHTELAGGTGPLYVWYMIDEEDGW